MDEAIGRDYKINLKQLVKPRETMSAFGQGGRPDPSENDGLLLDPDRKLFCSELVAKVFKCIGIMPTKQSCGNFFPHHLSSDKWKLPLIKEIIVENEKFCLPPPEEKDKKVAFAEKEASMLEV